MSRDRTHRSTRSTLSTQRVVFSASSAISALIVAACASLSAGCGKKGPPLPPLIKLPVAPVDFTATRRGDTVEIQFTVPASNTDDTRPANVERVEVYAFEGGPPVNEADFMTRGVKVATVPVKAPRNPDQTIEPDEPAEDIEPLEGPGLDQGSVARAQERLPAETPARFAKASDSSKEGKTKVDEPARPLLSLWMLPVPSRSYVSQGINKSGRKGPLSRPAIVPLVRPPLPPDTPTVSFSETAVAVTWGPPSASTASGAPAEARNEGVLPSRPIGEPTPALSYQVFDVAPASGTGGPRQETPLTRTPIAETRLSDERMTWGATRCYAVRAVSSLDGLTIQSEEQPPSCVTLKDTFAPAAPNRLTGVASEGAISLIWEPSNEKDLEGYVVLRGEGAAPAELKPITPAPIHETNFRDAVQPGARYAYAVQAVDKTGNVSPMSNRVEEAAR